MPTVYVCLSPVDGGWQLYGQWLFWDITEKPESTEEYHLRIVEKETQQVLLDQSTAVQYELTRVDDCHRCWGATATFEDSPP